MYLTSTMRRTLAFGGVSLLAVAGLIGWTRRESAPNTPVSTNIGANEFGEPYVASVSGGRIVYAPSPFGPEQATAPPLAPAVYAGAPAVVQTVAVQRRYYRTRSGRRRYVVVRKRPFRRSAAIVGGSAAGGAVIGALAGGGKGAGIGALAGGAGGLIYDRMTHKKRVVVRR